MKIVNVETLIARGSFARSHMWQELRFSLHLEIQRVDWPVGSGEFTVYPESGKKSGEGNGVKPIKTSLMKELERRGWLLEEPLDIATVRKPGKSDAVLKIKAGLIVLEWETGNISSSHRSLNKMALGLQKQVLIAGVLVVPTRELAQYLTDRVGNFEELIPYFDFWRSIDCKNGVLEIVSIEHDATSTSVPKIPKGTDGRARK